MDNNALAQPATRLMTREKMREFLNAHGYPISKSYLDKICAPQVNEGPTPDRYWNRRPLYDPAKALAWAEAKSVEFKKTG